MVFPRRPETGMQSGKELLMVGIYHREGPIPKLAQKGKRCSDLTPSSLRSTPVGYTPRQPLGGRQPLSSRRLERFVFSGSGDFGAALRAAVK